MTTLLKVSEVSKFSAICQGKNSPDRSPFFFIDQPRQPVSAHSDDMGFGPDWSSITARIFQKTRPRPHFLLDDNNEIDDLAFCVSRSKLFDRTRRESDPHRYVETVDLPYVTLPISRLGAKTGVGLGDFLVAIHPREHKLCFGVVGDDRSVAKAESSFYLQDALCINATSEVAYLVFPETGVGQGTIPSIEQIQSTGHRLYHRGGDRFWSNCWPENLEDRTFWKAEHRRRVAKTDSHLSLQLSSTDQ